mgnify:CR=1 FL=1
MSSETLTNNTSQDNELENFFNSSNTITPVENNSIKQEVELTTITSPETQIIEPVENNLESFFNSAEDVKVSNLEKLEYAFDKNTQIIGNAYSCLLYTSDAADE